MFRLHWRTRSRGCQCWPTWWARSPPLANSTRRSPPRTQTGEDQNYWKHFLWPFQQMSGKSTAICWLSLERHWRSTVTRMTMCCHWSATFWTRMLSSLWLVTSLNLANTLVSRGNQRLLLSRLIWWPGEPISHIALIRILGWIFSLVFSFRSVEAATKVKSQPASFPQRIRTMPKKLSDTTPLKVSER